MNPIVEPAKAHLENAHLVLILGGSFDPVHYGHLHLLMSAQKKISADELILIPCGKPPHKNRVLSSYVDRIEMLKLACEYMGQRDGYDCKTIKIEDCEVASNEPSYTHSE